MDVRTLWDNTFPDVPNSDLSWLERYDEDVLIRSLAITKQKDRQSRFARRTARDIGRYVSAVCKKLAHRTMDVTIKVSAGYQITEDDRQRFLSKLVPCGNCLLYAPGSGLYGRFKVNGNPLGAHQFAFFDHRYGVLPEFNEIQGLEIDHKCSHPRCCRPDHLVLVSRSLNLLRRDLRVWGVGLYDARGESSNTPPIDTERIENVGCTDGAKRSEPFAVSDCQNDTLATGWGGCSTDTIIPVSAEGEIRL